MSRALHAAGIALVLVARAPAKTPAPRAAPHQPPAASARPPLPPLPPPRVWTRPSPPLPMLPSVGRVRLEAARDHVIVMEDVNLPRGEWQSGGLDLYVAFGAPSTPLAVDARLLTVAAGTSEPRAEETGEAVATEPAVRRSPASQPLLGKSQMAGVVVHLREPQLRRGYTSNDVVVLRVRTLLPPPSPDATGARDVVVRLGASGGVPLTLGHVQVLSLEPRPWITRAEATLCGPDATQLPLTVALLPAGKPSDPPPPKTPPTIAPEMAVRHPTDDLCIRWWAGTEHVP